MIQKYMPWINVLIKGIIFDFIEVKPSLKDINIDDNNIYIDPEWMAITNAFNDYFPNENKNYSLLDIFSENSKLLYNDIVLDKIRIDRNNIVDIIYDNDLENKINDLILKIFNKNDYFRGHFEKNENDIKGY